VGDRGLGQDRLILLNVIVTEDTDPARNLTLEESLLREVDAGTRGDTFRLWINDPCLVAGPRRSARYGWFREDVAAQLGVPVFSRESGGGAVYHDHGNVNWSFYLRREEGFVGVTKLFRPFAERIAAVVTTLGIAASFALPNRIDAAGLKISGLAARAIHKAALVHGTLLVATDLERLNALCLFPPGCPAVVNLRDFAPGITADAARSSLAAAALSWSES